MMKNRKSKAALAILLALIMVCSVGILSVSAESAGTWLSKPVMCSLRTEHGMVCVYESFYVIGGKDYDGNALNSVEMFMETSQCWISKAPMPTARYDFATVALNGKIYVIGGKKVINGTPVYYSNVEVYDVNTDTWTTASSLPTALFGLSATVVNGKIYAIGGAYSETSSMGSVFIYDPNTNNWTVGTAMPSPRVNLRTVAMGDNIYAIGGTNQNSGSMYVYNNLEVYDTVQNTWTSKAPMTTARFGFGTAVVDGKIYTMGGKAYTTNNTYEDSDVIEIYYINENRWGSLPKMPSARSMFGTAEFDGKIYTTGGTYSWGVGGTAEAYIASPFTAPTNLVAKAGDGKVTLTWNAGNRAIGYYVKRATSPGGPYTQITNYYISELTYTDTDVINGTAYYYIVTSAKVGVQGDSTPEVSATPGVQPSITMVQLVITMVNGTVRQYELPIAEAQAFLDWYDAKSSGSGKAYYCINKYNDLGNFVTKKDYINFDKICLFEMNEY